MTESELLASPEFLTWCRVWEAERRCPFAMADWCLEKVSTLAFEACVWAHEKEERQNERVRPYPSSRGHFRLWNIAGNGKAPSDVPLDGRASSMVKHKSFPAAIAYYLTHFDAQLAKKYPPKREASVVAPAEVCG